MTIDMNKAIAQYAVVAQIANAIPELRGALQTAIDKQLSPDAFIATIAATPWYKAHAEPLRNLIELSASDPATYRLNLQNQTRKIADMAGAMGRTVDAASLAYQSLAGGWADAFLQTAVGNNGHLATNGGADVFEGGAAQLEAHLHQTAEAYGVPVTTKDVTDTITLIQSGKDTTDGFDARMRARAKAAYPQFTDQINAGMTVQQIADPYLATYAKTLEVPQSTVTINDPMIKKALSAPGPDGKPTSQPLWQFEQSIKHDPRYDKTDQAKTDAYTTLKQIGTDWGFSA